MPRKTREYLLRFADEAHNDLDRALMNVAHLAETYRDHHPDMSEQLDAIGQVIVQTQEVLDQFKKERM